MNALALQPDAGKAIEDLVKLRLFFEGSEVAVAGKANEELLLAKVESVLLDID